MTKAAVNRAGRLLARRLVAYREHGQAAFETFDPDEVVEAERIVDVWRDEHREALDVTTLGVRQQAETLGEGRVTQRLKKHDTIIDKLVRLPTMKLTSMEDIGGCRALVADQARLLELVDWMRNTWEIVRHRDYVTQPKPDGYRAHHLVTEIDGCRIEIQLRTPVQDLWANAVEQHGRRLDLALKSGRGPDEIIAYYRAVSRLLAIEERGEIADGELIDQLSDLAERLRPDRVDEDEST